MNHDLHHYMNQLSDKMAADYTRLQQNRIGDSGTMGDQAEQDWAQWMREWLPPTYQVVTKGRIINHEGQLSRQIDVLILKPYYPKSLHYENHYFSAGVAAAFECKTTLKASHIHKAIEVCVGLKNLYPSRTGSPYKELHTPIAYGLLAHSHDWKGEKSTPIDNIQQQLSISTLSQGSHPRLGLDFLCVADLGTWVLTKITPNASHPSWGGHLPHIPAHDEEEKDFTAIGSFYVYLMEWLAWENPALRDIVDYYRVTGAGGQGSGNMPYQWDFSSVYSEAVQNQIKGGRLSHDTLSWDEWKSNFGLRMQFHMSIP